MAEQITAPTMGEILLEEFMEPLHLSAYRLAQDIRVPVSRIQDILHGLRKVTADTSVRLGKYFGVSMRYFLHLQDDIDIRQAQQALGAELEKIPTLEYA